jgi:two-component system sensor histidine kinase CreC
MAVSSDDFSREWQRLVQCLDVVERHAATHQERARVLAVRRALEDEDLVGVLCHDLKDPLAAITMGAALLKKQLPNERAVDALASATRRLDRVVQNARDLDLLRKGAYAPQIRPLPVASVILPNVERVRDAAAARKITIAFEPADLRGVGDPHATSRAFAELLDNAVGFAPEGTNVRVTLTEDATHVRVHVDDEGAGIDDVHLPHAFDEAKNRSHRPRRGAGRGLPLARAYAQAQGGDVELSMRSPNGCRATLLVKRSA